VERPIQTYRARVPHEREGDQQLRAAEKSLNYVLGSRRAILRDPAVDVFEIGNRLVVEDKLHRALRAQFIDARPSFRARQQFAIGVSDTTTHLFHLSIGQADLAHVLHIVKQRSSGGILIVRCQLFDLAQRFFK